MATTVADRHAPRRNTKSMVRSSCPEISKPQDA